MKMRLTSGSPLLARTRNSRPSHSPRWTSTELGTIGLEPGRLRERSSGLMRATKRGHEQPLDLLAGEAARRVHSPALGRRRRAWGRRALDEWKQCAGYAASDAP